MEGGEDGLDARGGFGAAVKLAIGEVGGRCMQVMGFGMEDFHGGRVTEAFERENIFPQTGVWWGTWQSGVSECRTVPSPHPGCET